MLQTLQQAVSLLTALLMSLQSGVALIPNSTQLAQVTPTATISLSPGTNSVAVNSTFNVNILLNTGGQSAYGVDINRLRFNPSTLQVVDADTSTPGIQISSGSLMSLTIINSVDNTTGTIQFSQLANPGSTYSGSGILASINFRAISSGVSNVTFDFSLGNSSDTNVAGLGGDLLSSVSSGSYTVTNPDTTPPSTPQSLSATSVSSSQINLSWNASTDNVSLSGYRLERCQGSGCTSFTQIATPSSNSYSDTSLSSNTSYTYRVRAVDSSNNLSSYSNTSSATTQSVPDTTAPTTPGTPSLTVNSSSQINITWTASVDTGGSGLLGYRLERCSGSSTCSSYAHIATSTTNSYSDTGLTASTIYRYRLRAIDNAYNISNYSNASSATTQAPPDNTPPTISSLNVSSISSSGATISWTTNEPSDTQVEYGLTSSYGNSTNLNSSMVTSHSASITGLSAGTQYNYRVKSRDANGNLSTSANNTFTTQTMPDTNPPSIPSNFSATSTSETQIQLNWNPSTDSPVPGQTVSGVAYYQIFRANSLIATTTSTSYLNTSLTPGVSYTYQITAVDVAGNISQKSQTVSATTPISSLAVQRRIIISPEASPTNQRVFSGIIEFIDPLNPGLKIFQSNFTTNSTGQYLIDIPSGLLPTVNFRIILSGYLSKIVNSVDLRNTSVIDVNFGVLTAGDFNSDSIINSVDFSYMNSKWNSNDFVSDINKDSIINSLDFAYISNNWLKIGE